jgi:hypothetical protein
VVIPPDLDREGLEHYRLKVERLLNRLTLEAEAWAHAGTPKAGEFVPRPQPAWSKLHPEVNEPIAAPWGEPAASDPPSIVQRRAG